MNIFHLLTGGVQEIANKRVMQAKRLTQMRWELRFEEARMQAALPPHAKTVLKGKSIILLQRLLEEQNFPDVEIGQLLKGVDLVGQASKSPLFGTKVVAASTTPEFLLQASPASNEKIMSWNVHEDEPELAEILWETTLQECEKGFLRDRSKAWRR